MTAAGTHWTAESAWWGDVWAEYGGGNPYARARDDIQGARDRGASDSTVATWTDALDNAQANNQPKEALAIAQYAREWTEDAPFSTGDGASTRPDDPLEGTLAGTKAAAKKVTTEVADAIPTPVLAGAGVFILLAIGVYAYASSRA